MAENLCSFRLSLFSVRNYMYLSGLATPVVIIYLSSHMATPNNGMAVYVKVCYDETLNFV